MKDLIIENLKDVYSIPSVHFNAQTGICEIAGDSYMEGATYFYEQLINWLEEFITTWKNPIVFNFKLNYFNTSTSKSILDILHVLRNYQDYGGTVTISWYLDQTQFDIEDIEDFMDATDVKINIINV